jgi:hypothetical protein
MLVDELMRQWPVLGQVSAVGWLALAVVAVVLFFRR